MKNRIIITVLSILLFVLTAYVLNLYSDFYSGSALESAFTLRNGISWSSMLKILLLSGIISLALPLVLFLLFSMRGYKSDIKNNAFSFSFRFSLTVMLVISLLLFFDTVQFGIIASGLSIWALLSTVIKKEP